MKKPEKKKWSKWEKEQKLRIVTLKEGYNQAIDDYEKFLPSEEEIFTVLNFPNLDVLLRHDEMLMKEIAKAIAKRIGKIK